MACTHRVSSTHPGEIMVQTAGFPVACALALACLSPNLRAAGQEDSPWTALPATDFDPAVPTPEQFFGGGYRVGSRHLQHHELLAYFQALEQASPRVRSRDYARSHGERVLRVSFITSPANHERLDEIAARRRRWTDPRLERGTLGNPPPLAMYLGYSVHGNEASGGNAAPLVAYYLAAAQDEVTEQLLSSTIILLDPCLNPDGFDRFASWVNRFRGRMANPDPAHREHREDWPGGRTNYYFFDLNRDWLPAEQPESQGRLRLFREWRPNVVLDFHEMGTRSTFFFQPGVPQRKHPDIPMGNVELTQKFARFHADALDRFKALYYTEETFDDFYPGKGATYADLHGGVGILFEQASARGLVQENDYGPLTFPYTIRNQVLTSISSLQAAATLRRELLEHQRLFYERAWAAARQGPIRAHLYSAPHDPVRLAAFRASLARHGIQSHPLREDITIEGRMFRRADSLLVPVAQPEAAFLQVLLERRTAFDDDAFYDISAWTLSLAFNLEHAPVDRDPAELADLSAPFALARPQLTFGDNDVAYVIDGRGYYAPRTLQRLLQNDILVTVARDSFAVDTDQGRATFEPGALVVPLGPQRQREPRIRRVLQTAAAADLVRIAATGSALTPDGIDLGSPHFPVLSRPSLALLVGDGVRASEAGEVWHLLDVRYQIPVTLVDVEQLSQAELERYSAIVMVSGSYGGISPSEQERLQRWVESGGTLVAIGTATRWAAETPWVTATVRSAANDTTSRRPFREAAADAARRQIAGAILRTDVDTSHPLAFGLTSSLPVFRDHTLVLELAANPYANPVVYSPQPLMAGYVSEANLRALQETAAAQISPAGSGRVILLLDNPNFRAFWYGTNRLFLNAVLYGPLMRSGTSSGDQDE